MRSLGGTVLRLVESFTTSVVDCGVVKSPVTSIPGECDGVVALVATGGTEQLILSLAAQGRPLLLVSTPYFNGLPAALEAIAAAREKGGRVALVHVNPAAPGEASGKLSPALRALRAVAWLRSARLGVIGSPSPWLVYSRVEPRTVEERVGVRLVPISLEEFYNAVREARVGTREAEELIGRAEEAEVDEEAVIGALKVYYALKKLVSEYNLDAITVECFRLIEGLRATPCLAFSLLNSEGIVAGCEADVPSTITMMLLSRASSSPAFMANPAHVEGNTIVLAHCTAPLTAGPYKLLPHFESGLGVGVSVAYPPNTRVTIARLSPDFKTLRVLEGVIARSGLLSRRMCRTQVEVRVEGDVGRLLGRSIGNHYVMVVGSYTAELNYAAQLLGAGLDII